MIRGKQWLEIGSIFENIVSYFHVIQILRNVIAVWLGGTGVDVSSLKRKSLCGAIFFPFVVRATLSICPSILSIFFFFFRFGIDAVPFN